MSSRPPDANRVDLVASGRYLCGVGSVGIKVLNSKLSEYVRRAEAAEADRLGTTAQAQTRRHAGRSPGGSGRESARPVVYVDSSVALAHLADRESAAARFALRRDAVFQPAAGIRDMDRAACAWGRGVLRRGGALADWPRTTTPEQRPLRVAGRWRGPTPP